MRFQPLPDGFLSPCDRAGTLVSFTYETGEAGAAIPKHALAYLPYGYDENPGARYPVLYLMHGGGGNDQPRRTVRPAQHGRRDLGPRGHGGGVHRVP